MNIVGFFCFLSGIIHLIRSILSRNKIANYYYNLSKLIIIKKEKVLKLQLYFSILISLYVMILGLILILHNIRIIYAYILLFLPVILKYIFVVILQKMEYIKYSD